jgi:hypothetical protein
MSRTKAFKLVADLFVEEAVAIDCLACGVALTANSPSISANNSGKIKTKFRLQRSGAGELAISARMFLPP